MPTILDRIVETKREELAAALAHCPPEAMKARSLDAPLPKPFRTALLRPDVAIIAEIKRASPAAGLIRKDFDARAIARAYDAGGAAALSTLTDEHYFQGSLSIFKQVREAVDLPLLRKDFTLDPYHVYEGRAAGADAILLIVSILSDPQLERLYALVRELGMDALVEVHTQAEMERAVRIGADLIGINNRDLKTFETRLDTTAEIGRLAPAGAVLVALSGIKRREDVEVMARSGARAALVGESLMREADIQTATRKLVGVPLALSTELSSAETPPTPAETGLSSRLREGSTFASLRGGAG